MIRFCENCATDTEQTRRGPFIYCTDCGGQEEYRKEEKKEDDFTFDFEEAEIDSDYQIKNK